MNHENTKYIKHPIIRIIFRVFILSCFRDERLFDSRVDVRCSFFDKQWKIGCQNQ